MSQRFSPILFFSIFTTILLVSIATDAIGLTSIKAAIQEEVLLVSSARDSSIQYEVTVFSRKDHADGSTPVIIINHGSSSDKKQGRERAIHPTEFFLSMNWIVVLPMRRGYAHSTGSRISVLNCDLTRYGLENAADIEDVVTWLRQNERFKSRKIVMIGQSAGGLATMAYSSLPDHRVDAIINFHGGMRPSSDDDCKWQARIDAFATYAKTSYPRSLWIYTANDHSSNPQYIRKLYQAFTQARGEADLHQLPVFEDDGHYLLSRKTGGALWQPVVMKYLRELNVVQE